MMNPKGKAVIIALILAVGAVIITAAYRYQAAPGIVIDRILRYWRPGYHNIVDDDWLPQVDYEPLYRVTDFKVLKIKIQKDTASVLARVKYQTGHREPRDEMCTFVLKKTRSGWKASHYSKGLTFQRKKAASLEEILQESSPSQ